MYELTLTLHSWLRWVVLGLTVAVLWTSFAGWRGASAWTPAHNRSGILWMAAFDLQFLIGLVLYFGLSPLVQAGMAFGQGIMADRVMRFYLVEHLTLMLLAVGIAHIGRIISKKAASPDKRHKVVFLTTLASLLLVLLAIPWPFFEYGRPLFRL